uniref:Uncharacterized protein n=1 Tax=Arundo donax TaxID=35708 RepID=A0A0A9HG59_ARUDO
MPICSLSDLLYYAWICGHDYVFQYFIVSVS